jgi:hypothetical protein
MSLFHDLEAGDRLEFRRGPSAPDGLLSEARKVVVQVVQKNGQKYVRLAIDAPDDIKVALIRQDSVIFASEGI